MTQLLNVDTPDNLDADDFDADELEDWQAEEIPEPNIDHLVLEDDTPVDNWQSEKQQRLLTEPLYSSGAVPLPFAALANMGLFYKLMGDPVVPDAMLSLGIRAGNFSEKKHRSYLAWQIGKLPEVVIEIVSNRKGDELVLSRRSQQKGKTTAKKELYAQIGIPYYAVFDPLEYIQEPEQMDGQLLKIFVRVGAHYEELSPPFWLEDVGLGLTLWEGEFEQVNGIWLRWCDRAGQVIPTGAERANQEATRADRLAERLRSLGVDLDTL